MYATYSELPSDISTMPHRGPDFVINQGGRIDILYELILSTNFLSGAHTKWWYTKICLTIVCEK